MKNFLSLVQEPDIAKKITSIALGKFDGIHIAHKKLFDALDENGIVLCIEVGKGELLPKEYREFYSPKPMFFIALDIIRSKNDGEFIDFLCGILPNLKKIVVGYDFRFGKNRACDVNDLRNGFKGKVKVIEEVFLKRKSVHSGLIKECLIYGNLKDANRLLGRFYELRGEIIRGQGLGKKQLYATINIKNDGFILPQEGVYAGFVQLGGQSKMAKKHPAVIFVGNRLSTDKEFAIEGHLLKKSLDIDSKNIKEAGFYFVKKIRKNQYFSSLRDLKNEITKDIQKANKILKKVKDG